jgi:hypothetical protein
MRLIDAEPVQRSTTSANRTTEKVMRLAAQLTNSGKTGHAIRTHVTRGYLLRLGFRPEKRGGVLMCFSHPVLPKTFPTSMPGSDPA